LVATTTPLQVVPVVKPYVSTTTPTPLPPICPPTCSCLETKKYLEAGYTYCGGKQTVCGKDSFGNPLSCFEKPALVTTTTLIPVLPHPLADVTAPTATFTAPVRNGTVPFTVEFVDLSDGLPTSWQWDFGDGTGSWEKNPVHTYTRTGTYTVSLRVTNTGGGDTATKSDYITVIDIPVRAAFTAATLQGTAPLPVQFQDFSTGEVLKWDWEFGDGGHSTDKDPHYTYTRPGTYSVQLTVGSATGDMTSIRTDYIVVRPPVTTIPATIISEPACIEEYTGEGRIRSGPDGTLTCTARVRVTSGETTLELPAGTRALDNVGAQIPVIAISPMEASEVPPLPVEHKVRFSGIAYRCSPEGATFDPAIFVRITVPEDTWNGHDPANLTLWAYSDGIKGWEALPTTADTTSGTLHGSLNHFSIIALAEMQSGLDSEPPETLFTRIREAAGPRHVPLPLSGLIPKVYSPLAACALSFALIGIGAWVQSRGSVWLTKIREILSKYFSFLAIGKMSDVEMRKRRIQPNPISPFIFGLSARELVVIIVSALVFTLAFIVKDRLQVIMVTLGVFVLMGGIAVVAHELGHRITAGRCQCETELQFWGLGTLTMLLTAWLFGNIFAKPSRTVLQETPDLTPRQRALIMVAGPTANLLFAALSLILLFQGGIFALAGGVGVSINLLVGVIALLPVKPMDGRLIFRWNPLAWLVIFVPVLIVYLAIQTL
jgi:PKD repeat protein/Zn-dependent protease